MPQNPETQKTYRSTADLGACAGNSRRCAGQNAGRARSKQVCCVGFGQFRCGVVCVTSCWGTDATKIRDEGCAPKSSVVRVLGRCCLCGACPATNRRDQKPTRGVCSEEQCRPHVVRRCRPCGTCSATNRRGPCHLTAVVVAVVGGRALPPLRSHPRRNSGCGLDGKQKQNRYEKKFGEIGGTLPQ